MNWFKIKVNEAQETYTYIGSSPNSLDELIEQARQGIFNRLDDLVYRDRGEIKEWAEWDKSEMPSVRLNPKMIVAIMQFKADPRTFSKL